jgi:hypothetical protein
MFSYYDIRYFPHHQKTSLLLQGYVKNESSRDYKTVIFRAKLFSCGDVVGSALIHIHDLTAGASKPFEVVVEDTSSEQIPMITKCEIIMESGY